MKQFLCVGTYTEPILFGTGEVFQGKGQGVYICSFDEGEIKILQQFPVRNPSYLCINEEQRKIYTVNEMKEYLGAVGGGVTQLCYDEFGVIQQEATYNTAGTDPCHIQLAPNGKFISVANFASGTVTVFPVQQDGNLNGEKKVFQHEGSSIHPKRQKGPHAHGTVFCPGVKRMYVPDLGIDKLKAYTYEGDLIVPAPEEDVVVPVGNGPRFGEFTPDGKHFYLINEIASCVLHFTFDQGQLTEKESVNTLPPDFTGDNICSDLHITPNGRYLYASNRGHDSIVAYRICMDGHLEEIACYNCGGHTPRNFAIDPKGKYVLVGNQDSDTIAIFAIQRDGSLVFQRIAPFATPVCIRFFEKTTFDKTFFP